MNEYIGTNPLEAHRYLELLDLADAGHIDEALHILDDFLAANQHLDKDGELRGRVLSQKALFAATGQRWTEAVEFYRSAQPFVRERWVFLSNQAGLARALAEMGEFDAALQELDDALAASQSEPHNVLGLLWNYVHISEQVGLTVPERYRDLLLASCQVHGVQLPSEMVKHSSLSDAVLTAHQMVRDSQKSRTDQSH